MPAPTGGGTHPVIHCQQREYQRTSGRCAGLIQTRPCARLPPSCVRPMRHPRTHTGHRHPARPRLGQGPAAAHRRGRRRQGYDRQHQPRASHDRPAAQRRGPAAGQRARGGISTAVHHHLCSPRRISTEYSPWCVPSSRQRLRAFRREPRDVSVSDAAKHFRGTQWFNYSAGWVSG
jgi:hypothetical protein